MNKMINVMMTIGGVLLLVGAMVMITGWGYAPYIYLLGSVMFASAQLSDRYDGDDMILKRLRLQQVLGSILLVITGFLMFSSNYHQQLMFNNSMNDTLRSFLLTLTARNSWIVTLCIATLFELYSSFRIDARNKELE
ncbi:MAG: hypothetical protein J6Q97_02585, partial [Bacteroidaceae bacterium]|nr:hypothetical protein [Bacteroidaceae bacterium]